MSTPIKSHTHGFMHSDNGLRDYQKEAKQKIYQAWDEVNNVMFQMPTGTGKTVLFASIINDLFMQHELKNVRVVKILIVAHRDELINQISSHISKRCIKHGIIQGGQKKNYQLPIQVGSINTVSHKNREAEIRALNFDYIIIDEAHHATANLYRKLWDYFPESKKLGVTATPCRLDGTSFTDLFDKLILSWPVKKFIEEKWLSPYQYFSVPPTAEEKQALASIKKFTAGDYDPSELERKFDNMHIRARLYQAYEQYAKGKKGIIYAIKIKHSNNICEDFKKHGVKAVSIDSKMSATERRQLVDDFKKGAIDVIVNVDIFSEGFDCPDIEFIQLARPTQSLTKYLQQVGRGLRITSNKTHCIILDNVGMYERFGFPNADRKWQYHFNGKDKDGKEIKNALGNGTKEYTEPDMSEGIEEMAMLQGEVNYMELPQTEKVVDEGPLPFVMPNIDEMGISSFLTALNYSIDNIAFYFDEQDCFYDYQINEDNRIFIYKLVFDYQGIKHLWEGSKFLYKHIFFEEPTDDSEGFVKSTFHTQLSDYWDMPEHKKVVASVTPKAGEDYERLLLHNVDHDDLERMISKYSCKSLKYNTNHRSFKITKNTEFFSYLINARINLSFVGNCATIAKSSPLAHIIKRDISDAESNIVYFSEDEIWIIDKNFAGEKCIKKFTRDGRPLSEDTQKSITSETNYQKIFWEKGRLDWSNEKFQKQFKSLAPYLYKKHSKFDYSFDLEKGPKETNISKNQNDFPNKEDFEMPEDSIEIGSKYLYATKIENGYKVYRKDGHTKWNTKLHLNLNAESNYSKAGYFFFDVDFELYALSSESFPYLWKADEALISDDVFIVYRPGGKCDYYNKPSNLGMVRCVHYSETDSYLRLYINKKKFLLIGPELNFIKTVENKFHSSNNYYHDGMPIKYDL